MPRTVYFPLLALIVGTVHGQTWVADEPKRCEHCDEWNQALGPFPVAPGTWYVGTQGLSAVLITSDQGHILIDGALPQSAPLIAANIEKAGFRLSDVKLILNSHTHHDHAGGIAALQRASGAQVVASPKSKDALERGGPTEDDPQFAFGRASNDFAAVAHVRAIADGEILRLGPLAVTAHFTPGHTPGGTTWAWKACDPQQCLNVVYADSLNPVAAPGFRFSDETARVTAFQASITRVAGLTCDILLAPHPELFDRDAKLAARSHEQDTGPFVRRGECRTYAERARLKLAERLSSERR